MNNKKDKTRQVYYIPEQDQIVILDPYKGLVEQTEVSQEFSYNFFVVLGYHSLLDRFDGIHLGDL